ncbi:retrovirus-related pol polyprotein from transposon TNT 1-94 [Tanacetum coccineum]|uniref:Retrovirus-related pol polyprotein from transposon TNT 1-94 n=1 Tax=Tanacetum coccineum TaxID=301880 RepID=A0ABQ5GKH8_9ASTR
MLNEIESLKAQLRSKEPCFTSDYVKPKVLAPGMYAIDVKPIPHPLKNNRSAHLNYISHLKESVETELLEYVIGTCPKSFNERDNKAPSTPVTRKKQVTFSDKPGTSSSNTQKHKVHQRVQQTNIPGRTGHALVSGLRLFKTYDRESFKAHLNFVEKFIGSVRFGNDHVLGANMGSGDYVMGDHLVISKSILREGLGHNLFSVGLVRGLHRLNLKRIILCTALSTMEKARSSHHRPTILKYKYGSSSYPFTWICTGPLRSQSIKGKKSSTIMDDYSRFTCKFLEAPRKTPEFRHQLSEANTGVGIFHQKSVPRTPQQNGVVERRNRTLVEAARTMMIFSKAPMFLWAKAVATACYTQNRSLIHTRHNKTPYELVHDKA